MKNQDSEEARDGGVSRKRFWILLLGFLILVLFGLFLILMDRESQTRKSPAPPVKIEIIRHKAVVPAVDSQIPSSENSMKEQPLEAPTPTSEKTSKAQPSVTPSPTLPPPSPPKPERFYEVKRGECLWEIAAKPEVYNDPEMWRVLYRANPRVMDYYYQKNGVPFVIINPGIRLKIPEPQEIQSLQDAAAKKLWVLQLSANRNIRFALLFAAKLKGPGRVVFVTEDRSGRQPWYMVRIGFFTSREKAGAVAGEVTRQTGHSEYVIRTASSSEITAHLPFS